MSKQQPLRLFEVTLPWNPSDPDEGSYTEDTWAANFNDAVRNIAMAMSELADSGCESASEKAQFVNLLVTNAGPGAAECVAGRLLGDIHKLMGGPGSSLSPEAVSDFGTLATILRKYGATHLSLPDSAAVLDPSAQATESTSSASPAAAESPAEVRRRPRP